MNTHQKTEPLIYIIACGVLTADIKHVIHALGLNAELRALPGGLHAKPHELNRRLQETIDEVSAIEGVARIVLGYGVCGRGAVGIRARRVPLVIPRIHDCIALFLGSDARYREQFARNPGTYYLSAGWAMEKGAPGMRSSMGSDGGKAGAAAPTTESEQLRATYGEDNAAFIDDFMGSWKRNYTRAAFIDTGVGDKPERYARLADDMAKEYGWKAERLKGTHELLIKTLTTTQTDAEVLVVPPGHVTQFDGLHQRLNAISVDEREGAADPTVGPAETEADLPEQHASGVGLGIDAGGTYTDAVLYDLGAERVLGKAKALTTKWDYTIGIDGALSQLDRDILARVTLVAVSTTLATNAIVEGQGQRVGLLVMPPYGRRDMATFQHTPMAYISGQLEIDGTELEPVDLAQVRTIARDMVNGQQVQAFAVGGYASHVNHTHELAVKEVVEKETGLPVTCSHDISEGLHFRIRAETAALNARIIPCLRALIDALQPALETYAVEAPIMIVRSDGSLMGIRAALERPLETMLSGPAASAAGAARLAAHADAMVVDIGGTTTDTAIIRDGQVAMCDEGATIGGWQTHIRALDLRTLGLGGDSVIRYEQAAFMLGPQRVTPLACLAAQQSGVPDALQWLDAHLDAFAVSTDEMAVLALTESRADITLTADESALVTLLRQRPHSLHELKHLLDKPHTRFLPVTRLAQCHAVHYSGLTPSDLLHISGGMSLWDVAVSRQAVALFARLAHQDEADLVRVLLKRFEHDLAIEMLERQITQDGGAVPLNAQPAAMDMIRHALDADAEGYDVALTLHHPVIGIGAPATHFVPAAAGLLHAESIVPDDADVANAIGAITGAISLRRRVTISVNEQMLYRLGGVPDSPAFTSIEAATVHGEAYLREVLTDLARQAGADSPRVVITRGDSIAPSADGQAIFVGRTLYGYVTGSPA